MSYQRGAQRMTYFTALVSHIFVTAIPDCVCLLDNSPILLIYIPEWQVRMALYLQSACMSVPPFMMAWIVYQLFLNEYNSRLLQRAVSVTDSTAQFDLMFLIY